MIVDDSAEGQGLVPRLVEPRFLVQVRKTEVTIASTTPQRLVEGLGTGAKVDENGPGGVDGRDEYGSGVRCYSALSSSGYHRYGAHQNTADIF